MLGALQQHQIDHVLYSESIGRIGCSAEGKIYVVPITYVYDGTSIYCHSFEGMKLQMMRANPHVCFEVDHIETVANWQSVIAWGTFEELAGDAAEQGLNLFIERLAPYRASETELSSHVAPYTGSGIYAHGKQVYIYRITLSERTGRFEKT